MTLIWTAFKTLAMFVFCSIDFVLQRRPWFIPAFLYVSQIDSGVINKTKLGHFCSRLSDSEILSENVCNGRNEKPGELDQALPAGPDVGEQGGDEVPHLEAPPGHAQHLPH